MSELKQKIIGAFKGWSLTSLATVTPEGKPWVRYVMMTIDENLTVRGSTFTGSRKAAQIMANPEVHITCGVTSLESAEQYVQIQGRAEISTDPEEKKAFWQPMMSAYYKGPDDPNYCVIIVKPYHIEFMGMGSMMPEIWKP